MGGAINILGPSQGLSYGLSVKSRTADWHRIKNDEFDTEREFRKCQCGRWSGTRSL